MTQFIFGGGINDFGNAPNADDLNFTGNTVPRNEFNIQPAPTPVVHPDQNPFIGGNIGDTDFRTNPEGGRVRLGDRIEGVNYTGTVTIEGQQPASEPETHYPTIDELLGPPASDPAGVIELEMDGRHDYFVVGELEFERELPPRLPYQHEQSLPLPPTRLPNDSIEFDGAVGFSRRVPLGGGVSVLVTSNEDTGAGGMTWRFTHPSGPIDIRLSQRPGAPGTDQTITHRTEENYLGVVFDRTTTLRNNSGQPTSISSESGATFELTDDISVSIRRNDNGLTRVRLNYDFGDVRGNINYNILNDKTGFQIQTNDFRFRAEDIFGDPSFGANGIIRF